MAEIILRRRFGAIDADAELGDVEVDLHDPLLLQTSSMSVVK